MRYAVLCGSAIVLLAIGACSGSPSTPSSGAGRQPSSGAPAPAPAGPSRIFGSATALTYPLAAYTVSSRYVLYDDGAFALEYPSGEYRGTYQESGGTITFNWEGTSSAGPWGATGTLENDRLVVRYNLVMQLTDFEDAVYRRSQ
jgi:hypothetical protein